MEKFLMPEKWLENYGDLLYAFALKRLNYNVEQAEDVVQDVFLNAWRSRDSFTGVASEKNWLMTICKNRLIDLYRKEGKIVKVDIENDSEDDSYFENGHFRELFKTQPNWNREASKHIENKEFYNILNFCKTKLKKIQQQVFAMKYIEDVNADEICELLGITHQNYWVLMHRAKIQLRACLEKNWINS